MIQLTSLKESAEEVNIPTKAYNNASHDSAEKYQPYETSYLKTYAEDGNEMDMDYVSQDETLDLEEPKDISPSWSPNQNNDAHKNLEDGDSRANIEQPTSKTALEIGKEPTTTSTSTPTTSPNGYLSQEELTEMKKNQSMGLPETNDEYQG